MAEGEGNIPSPFDVRTIKYLVKLMGRFDLSEVDLREGDLRIRLRRGKTGDGPLISLPAPVVQQQAAPAAAAPAATAAAAPPAKKLLEIKSPTPGTFYSSPKPDAEVFVKVGARVQPDTVVCLIEAMKVFNEITADCQGTIVEVLASNQQPVEYGQVLFRVDPGA